MREHRIVYILLLTAVIGTGITFCTSRLLELAGGPHALAGGTAAGAAADIASDIDRAVGTAPEQAAETTGYAKGAAGASGAAEAGEQVDMTEDVSAAAYARQPVTVTTSAVRDGAEAEEAGGTEGETAFAARGYAYAAAAVHEEDKAAAALEEDEQAASPEGRSQASADIAAGGVAISPLETTAAGGTGGAYDDADVDGGGGDGNPYIRRLQELDAQIRKSRENLEPSANGPKNQASNELRLWDSELSAIYNELLNRLGDEQAESLASSQREWLRSRDEEAVAAAKNGPGGSREGVDYTASLAESARARAYELASLYGSVLME